MTVSKLHPSMISREQKNTSKVVTTNMAAVVGVLHREMVMASKRRQMKQES